VLRRNVPFRGKAAGVLGKRADDMISKFGIYRSDYQFLVISDLFGNYLKPELLL
jgi:hypothetical protein